MIYFPKCAGKGSFPKSQIKSLGIVNNIGLPTSEFDWLGMKEKTYLIALVCNLSNMINMEKNNKFPDLHVVIRSLLRLNQY